MRRRSTAQPAMPMESKPQRLHAGETKTFRVSSGGETHTIDAATMDVQPDGLTFKDAQGCVVGVFRGYGLSAVVDDAASACQRDPCETVRASDFI